MNNTAPTHADDCERLLLILADAPADGLTMDEIHERTKAGEVWTTTLISRLLSGLGRRIKAEQSRQRGRKITRYSLNASI